MISPACDCDFTGAESCDPYNGACYCKNNVIGDNCDAGAVRDSISYCSLSTIIRVDYSIGNKEKLPKVDGFPILEK